MSTRRKFLFDCSALMAATLASPGVVVAESTAPFWRKRDLHEISTADFAGALNTPFHIQAGSGRFVKVTLAEVKMRAEKPLKPGHRLPPDAGNEKFSLIFSGLRNELLPQSNVYTVAHERLGRFDVFLAPICTRNPAKIDYELVVSRPRNQSVQKNQTKG